MDWTNLQSLMAFLVAILEEGIHQGDGCCVSNGIFRHRVCSAASALCVTVTGHNDAIIPHVISSVLTHQGLIIIS